MKKNQLVWMIAPLLITALLLGGCIIPSPAGAMTPAVETPASEIPTPAAEVTSEPTPAASASANAAIATVSTRSLRVRAEPLESAEVVAGISQGETYTVTAISADGQWVQLAIADTPAGVGWVSANFVSVAGAITDTATVEIPVSSEPLTTTQTAITVTTPVIDTATDTATTTATEQTTIPAPDPAAVTTTTAVTATVSPTTTVIAPPAPGFATVNTGGTRLRVRSEPNADAEIVGYVYAGETYG
ncbi:MAG: SH3 domain-containing protein, partial [Chloroflexota bacterium]|nr:SH3 domain-containing protein [Chloroflexota bacterium]